MADNRIEIDIVLDDGSISKGILKAEETAKKSGRNIGTSIEGSIQKGASKGLDSVSGKIRSVAGLFAGAFAGREIIRAFQSVTKEASDFENQLIGVKTLLDSNSFSGQSLEQGFKGLRDGALEVFKELPVDIESVNKALFDTVSAGVDAGKAIDVVRVAGQLATAGLTDISVATDGITTALNAFSIGADQADSVAAKFFTAQKLGKTTIEELSSSIGGAASTAAAAGVSFEELLAGVSAATTGGIATSSAFAGIRAIISNIAKPSKEAADTAKRLGVEFNLAALESKGLAGFLNDVKSAANGSTQDLKNLFGSAEAFNVAASLTGNQSATFKNALKEIGDEAKSAATFTNALAESLKAQDAQNKIFANQLTAIRIELGTLLQPIRAVVQDGILVLATSLRDLAKNEFVIAGLAKAFRLAAVAVGLLVTKLAATAVISLATKALVAYRTQVDLIKLRMNLAAKAGVTGFTALRGAVFGANLGVKALNLSIKLLKVSATLGLVFAIDAVVELVDRIGGLGNAFENLPLLATFAFNKILLALQKLSNFFTNNAVTRFLGSKTGFKFDLEIDTSVTEERLKNLGNQIDFIGGKLSGATGLLGSSGSSGQPPPPPTGGEDDGGGFTPAVDKPEAFDLIKARQEALRAFIIANQDLVISNREVFNEAAAAVQISSGSIDLALNSGEASLKKFQDGLESLKESTKKVSLDISNVINQTLVRGISGGVAVMTTALLDGQNAFKAFGEFTINLLGDFMIRVGEMAIQVGIAALGVKAALESLNPYVAIAAGAVLIALGTAFKNLSSGPSATAGGGGGGSIPAATNGGGGVSGGQIGNIGEDSELSLGQPETGRQAKIEVNIQGNVLDRRETALEIVEVLEEARFAGIEVAV